MGQALKFNTVSYAYGNSVWGDLLTNYNGTAISYDAIGNPTNWRNANALTWKARELQSLSVTGGPSVAFEYNSDGIRTKKAVGDSKIHNYHNCAYRAFDHRLACYKYYFVFKGRTQFSRKAASCGYDNRRFGASCHRFICFIHRYDNSLFHNEPNLVYVK